MRCLKRQIKHKKGNLYYDSGLGWVEVKGKEAIIYYVEHKKDLRRC